MSEGMHSYRSVCPILTKLSILVQTVLDHRSEVRNRPLNTWFNICEITSNDPRQPDVSQKVLRHKIIDRRPENNGELGDQKPRLDDVDRELLIKVLVIRVSTSTNARHVSKFIS